MPPSQEGSSVGLGRAMGQLKDRMNATEICERLEDVA